MMKMLGIGAAGAALAACAPVAAPAGEATEAGQEPAPAQGKTVIKIDHRGYAQGDALPVLETLIAEWESTHPTSRSRT